MPASELTDSEARLQYDTEESFGWPRSVYRSITNSWWFSIACKNITPCLSGDCRHARTRHTPSSPSASEVGSKAITATANKLARIVSNLMRYGVEYVKRTEAEYVEQQRERLEQNLHRKARELGYKLEKVERSREPARAEPSSSEAEAK